MSIPAAAGLLLNDRAYKTEFVVVGTVRQLMTEVKTSH